MGSDNLLHNFGDVQEIRNGYVVLKSIAVQGRFLNQGSNVSRHKLTLYWLLKLKFRKYPSIHTNYIISHSTI